MHVNVKVQDIEKPKPLDCLLLLTLRSIGIKIPSLPHQTSSSINLKDYVKENGYISLPSHLYVILMGDEKAELCKYNNVVKCNNR